VEKKGEIDANACVLEMGTANYGVRLF